VGPEGLGTRCVSAVFLPAFAFFEVFRFKASRFQVCGNVKAMNMKDVKRMKA
jgi:hypothetical protein